MHPLSGIPDATQTLLVQCVTAVNMDYQHSKLGDRTGVRSPHWKNFRHPWKML